MLKKEFETRTGFFPSEEMYAEIEKAYMDTDEDKDTFCRMYKCNENGLATKIQKKANTTSKNKDNENAARNNALIFEIEQLRDELKRTKRKLELEEEWAEYFNPEYMPQDEYLYKQRQCEYKFVENFSDIKGWLHESFGFSMETISIITSIPMKEKNRHGLIRTVEEKKYDRRPVYFASDLNYIMFEVCGYTYECINGNLYQRY